MSPRILAARTRGDSQFNNWGSRCLETSLRGQRYPSGERASRRRPTLPGSSQTPTDWLSAKAGRHSGCQTGVASQRRNQMTRRRGVNRRDPHRWWHRVMNRSRPEISRKLQNPKKSGRIQCPPVAPTGEPRVSPSTTAHDPAERGRRSIALKLCRGSFVEEALWRKLCRADSPVGSTLSKALIFSVLFFVSASPLELSWPATSFVTAKLTRHKLLWPGGSSGGLGCNR
jgi:hypothetical protein